MTQGRYRHPMGAADHSGEERAAGSPLHDRCADRKILAKAATALETIHASGDLSALDPWVERIDQLLDSHPEIITSAEADRLAYLLFVALSMRRPDHPRIEQWKIRLYAIFDQHDDPNLRILCGFALFASGHLSGERGGLHHFYQVLKQLAAKPEVIPRARIAERLVTVWFLGLKGAVAESLASLEEGLTLAEESNVHVWDGLLFVYAATGLLNEGNTEAAGALLGRMEIRLDHLTPLDRLYFHHLSAWCALLEPDVGRALFHQRRSLAGALELGLQNRILGTCHFGMAVILHERKETAGAREHLSRCCEIGRRIRNRDLGYLCDLMEAQIALDSGEPGQAAEHLRTAMAVGRELGFLKFTFWRSEVMARLCSFALQEGIAVDFVAQMIRRFDLFPAIPPWHVENWPWAVRVRTLGGFSLQVDGKDVTFSAKTPKKSLELLKALIAFGPSAPEGLLADLLWPQADGDAAIRSLEITLHRLRKLLGEANLIRRTGGRLLLDRTRIFVDTWAVEAILKKAAGEIAAEEWLGSRCRRLADLYRGDFLDGDDDLGWVLPVRKKLTQHYLYAVVDLGRQCEARHLYEETAALYLRALEREPQAEILYQRLIGCYLLAERRPEALDLYRRYQTMLEGMGLTIDHATAALVRSLSIFG